MVNRGVLVAALTVIIVLILLWGGLTYNRLVRKRNQVSASWAQVDVQLRRRHDLIPGLVETARGYAAHESATLQAVVRARNTAVAADGPEDRIGAEAELSQTLGRLLGLAEQYPKLRANHNFLALQNELATTENKIAYARQFYNAAVQSLNDSVQSIPSNLVAALTGIRAVRYFRTTGDDRDPVQVKF